MVFMQHAVKVIQVQAAYSKDSTELHAVGVALRLRKAWMSTHASHAADNNNANLYTINEVRRTIL